MTVIAMVVNILATIAKGLEKKNERIGNLKKARDNSNHSKNTEESPGDLRRLAVAQTLVKDHWLMLV